MVGHTAAAASRRCLGLDLQTMRGWSTTYYMLGLAILMTGVKRSTSCKQGLGWGATMWTLGLLFLLNTWLPSIN